MNFADAMTTEMSHTKTWNGADALATTGSRCLDLFGLIGSMRTAEKNTKLDLFDAAYNENPDAAMKLLFFARDIRGGYGERAAFNEIFAHLADTNRSSVVNNIPHVMEYGRAKDLYSLIGTSAENSMWYFMKTQFEADLKALATGQPVSLLAKWIATPNSSSKKTSELGKKTAKMLGYDYKNMREYKKLLRSLRARIDSPEAKMSGNKWDSIDYGKVPSKCMIQNRKAFARHDTERYAEYIANVNNGTAAMNMSATNPCEIMQKVRRGDNSPEINTMWTQLPTVCAHNALVVADTSGSMCDSYGGSIEPITVAAALAIYFAERNVGCFKNKYFTFSGQSEMVEIVGKTLQQKLSQIQHNDDWGNSTNLESVFDQILRLGIQYHISQSDMPQTIVIVSDMQINSCTVHTYDGNGFMTFTKRMKSRFEDAGYILPHIVYWNVNAMNPTFHAGMSDNAVSLVSGYSVNVMKQVMDNIGKTPMDLMNDIITSERYKDIIA